MPNVRKVTNQLREMMDDEMIDARAVADACLAYMSESEVADMAETNDLLFAEYDDDDS